MRPSGATNHLVKISTFAKNKGCTRTHIYDLIKEGIIEYDLIDDTKYIDADRYKDLDVFAVREKEQLNVEALAKEFAKLKKKVYFLEKMVKGNYGPSATA